MTQYLQAAIRLQEYIGLRHWNGQSLVGPDPGIRFNYRIGRFIKSYCRGVRWNDDLYYLQGQGYWVLANWHLFIGTGRETYRDIALRCSEYMLTQQRDDGAWNYPNWEWKGRIATVEGIWASLGLLESYRQTGEETFLDGCLKWYRFLVDDIGFQRNGDELAVNYFANRKDARVPNNSTDALRFLAELATVTGDKAYLKLCQSLLIFLRRAQKTTGEFPYTIGGNRDTKDRPHFQCYQYNAFECLGMIRYHEITGDMTPLPLITNVLNFLREGLAEDGHAFYECGNRHRAVTYHTAVIGAAFVKASQLGMNYYADLANRVYSYLLELQRPDGGFSYSQREYRLFSDKRSYPRYLAMILYHLLHPEPGSKEKPI